MAIEYNLTLAGTASVEEVAERAFPDADDRPLGVPPVLTADLTERQGFVATVVGGKRRFLDVMSDGGSWEWEPEPYVTMNLRLDKMADREWAVHNVLFAARRVLMSGSEDAVLVLNGDVLLLTRLGGELVRHHRADWWSHHPAASDALSRL